MKTTVKMSINEAHITYSTESSTENLNLAQVVSGVVLPTLLAYGFSQQTIADYFKVLEIDK